MIEENHHNRKRKPRWLRIIGSIFRTILVPLLCILGLIGGMMVGYSYFGEEPVAEVFSISTWKHLFDLVFS